MMVKAKLKENSRGLYVNYDLIPIVYANFAGYRP